MDVTMYFAHPLLFFHHNLHLWRNCSSLLRDAAQWSGQAAADAVLALWLLLVLCLIHVSRPCGKKLEWRCRQRVCNREKEERERRRGEREESRRERGGRGRKQKRKRERKRRRKRKKEKERKKKKKKGKEKERDKRRGEEEKRGEKKKEGAQNKLKWRRMIT